MVNTVSLLKTLRSLVETTESTITKFSLQYLKNSEVYSFLYICDPWKLQRLALLHEASESIIIMYSLQYIDKSEVLEFQFQKYSSFVLLCSFLGHLRFLEAVSLCSVALNEWIYHHQVQFAVPKEVWSFEFQLQKCWSSVFFTDFLYIWDFDEL